MKTQAFITALLSTLCCATAWANDGAVEGAAGRWHFMRGEHRNVRLVREAIRMDVYPKYYDAKVDFIFRNEGGPVTVTMGFPESGGGDINVRARRDTTGFLRFATWADGRRIKTRRELATAKDSDYRYQAFWVKRVHFARGQNRLIRVRYRAPHGAVAGEGRSTPYSFTGGNWRGRVERSTLVVVTHLSGPHEIGATFNWNRLPVRRRGNRFFYQWSNWQAEGHFAFWTASTLPGWLTIGQESSFIGRNPGRVVIEFPIHNRRKLFADGVYWPPPAVLRDGTTFINLNALGQWLRDKANKKRPAYFVVDSEVVNPRDKSITLRIRDDGVPQMRHSLRFQIGEKRMVLDGKKVLPLAVAPFPVGRFNSDLDVYVPLRPILKLLGGWARVDAAKHRLYFDAPGYEFWKS
ncbi:MAG TPA: hypothetical protein VNA16_09990 [Abditibacteriaceae bacterium]|nr:hypothetical protein [Abditibacteriaceae bacterium]